MKELKNIQPDKTKPATEQQILKQAHAGTLNPFPGQKLYELNKTTGTITEVQYQTSSVHFNTQEIIHTAITKPGCIYVLAINRRNAEKKFFKHLQS